ncbi:MAG: glycosyltransferase family 1 protein [Burkholderiales bacterium]|nr:glycosyltransferase family 1 protein [Burkholderiales bacterium]
MTLGRMVEAFLQRGHHVQLIRPRQHTADVATSRDRFEEILASGLPIPRYDGLRAGLPAYRRLLRAWRAARPDVVDVATEGPLGWSAVSAARRLRIPVVSEFHTNFQSYSRHYGIGWLRQPVEIYLRMFHNRTRVTMVPTREMRDALLAVGHRHVDVVARGVDTRMFDPAHRDPDLRASWGVGGDAPVVIHVGRLAPEKNLGVLLDGFRAIRTVRPDARLVLVGDGPERAALQRRHPEAVFAGMRTGHDLARHYASGDLFLFASVTETFGNVTLEALASGLAVVAYDYAAAREHIRHGESGLLAPFDDSAAFVGLAQSLATDPVRIAALRGQARQTASAIDWEQVFVALERILLRSVGRDGNAC